MNLIFREGCLLLIFLFVLKYQLILAQNRIVNGKEARISDHPYMARLVIPRINGFPGTCGASIIGKEWLLTAAHCFQDGNVDKKNVIAITGTGHLRLFPETRAQYNIAEFILNKNFIGIENTTDFNNITARGDIAVLKLAKPIEYNRFTQPIKLPEKNQPLPASATVAGWGAIQPGNSVVFGLRSVTVPKIDIEACKKKYAQIPAYLAKLDEICYSRQLGGENSQDKCSGDSGGPLVSPQKIQIGIVSWGIACGTRGYPGVYSNVMYYRDWIKEKTGI
ncbi:trypsin-like [Leptopilina boulardi]|uniref:trypsin-like n=1 Tax=Leptopilina boulardi TaxID=63433 RepID=UPI0021F57CD0|nr:trypsin-like [Leptopilina boulardi]